MKRTKILAILAIVIGASLASAGLLTYYTKVEVTTNVLQSVVVSVDAGDTWNDYNQPIERNLGDIIHCTDYTYKSWIWNRACGEAEIDIVDTWLQYPGTPEGFDITHYVVGGEQTINFYTKDTEWNPVGDFVASLTFETCSTDFEYTLTFETGFPETGEFALVYYPDEDPRMSEWGGDGGIVLTTFTAPSSMINGIRTGVPTLPYTTDWNACEDADYTASDNYEHARGAKFWIVPTSVLTNGNSMPIISWEPETFFFEDDLGLYVDCSEQSPDITWLPFVYPLFATTTLEPETVYCWLTNYHTVINIMPGTYTFNTKLIPVVEP